MQAHFAITIDVDRHLVRMMIGGFFAVEDVRALTEERRRRYAALRCPPNQHLTLCDARTMDIQSQEVVAAFSGFVRDPRYLSRRLAIVGASSLARMQARRVNLPDRPDVMLFDTVPDAETWLFAD